MSTAKPNFRARMIMGLALGLIGGFFAFRESAASALSDNSPALAVSINGDNEIAAQRMANLLMKDTDKKTSLESAKALTLNALNTAAGLAPSIRNYALLSDLKLLDGDPEALMQMATKFSRRDLPTQLWLIEKEAQGGDAIKTLAVYDLAMTSNPEIQEVLFPILAAAIADPELIGPIADLLKTEPTWGHSFYLYFNQDKAALGRFPVLLAALGSESDRLIPTNIRNALANNLINTGQWEAAYQTSSLGDKSITLSDFSNDADRIAPPFGWSFMPSGTVGFSVSDDHKLSINVGSGAGTIIATRVVRLSSENFKFSAIISSKNAKLDQVPRFAIACMDQTSAEKRLSPEPNGKKQFTFYENFSLQNCKFAIIKIIVPSNFSGPEFAASIEAINIL